MSSSFGRKSGKSGEKCRLHPDMTFASEIRDFKNSWSNYLAVLQIMPTFAENV